MGEGWGSRQADGGVGRSGDSALSEGGGNHLPNLQNPWALQSAQAGAGEPVRITLSLEALDPLPRPASSRTERTPPSVRRCGPDGAQPCALARAFQSSASPDRAARRATREPCLRGQLSSGKTTAEGKRHGPEVWELFPEQCKASVITFIPAMKTWNFILLHILKFFG